MVSQPTKEDLQRQELYDTLARACQAVGFCTAHTYELLHSVAKSVIMDEAEAEKVANG